MSRSFLALLAALLALPAHSQKMVHIPLYLQDVNNNDGAQFTWSKTAQSDNFILIWGNTVGTNPATYPDPDLRFNPTAILDTMEYIYAAFKQLGFVDDALGTKLSQYKVPVVIYGTWGANGAQGWANGGDADGVVGAFWAHPNAMHDGGVAAHEFAHSMQAQAVLDYRATHGMGSVWNNAGIFWESHANFMRNLLYPKAVSAWGMDVYHLETWGDWKNTYENYPLLFSIMASEGIDMVNRLWRESLSTEYPLQAYKRLAGYDQARFNDSLYHYARRMATYDFTYNNVGKYFRQYRTSDLNNNLPSVQATYNILKKVPGSSHHYEMPIEQAPEEFAYNIIPLYPENDSCAVIIKFKGHTEANTHTGWRYGFVAAHPNGTVSRYSPTYQENTAEIYFKLEGDETKMYLVVMGAPFDQITTNTTNDTWKGYPKHFRFPYELDISGALPEGFQAPASFRAQLKNNGHLHANGGGWVANAATVASTVYVGPMAMVLGNANLSGTVRVENTALVRDANLSGQVKVLENAFVRGGTYSNNAIIRGHSYVENATMSGNAIVGMRAHVSNYNLSGTVEVGGDVVVYNTNGNCNNGVYYRLTNYYDDKLLECDGRTANHSANKDVNNAYTTFSDAQLALQCQCAAVLSVDSVSVATPGCGNISSGSVQFYVSNNCGAVSYAWIKGAESGNGVNQLSPGSYSFSITDALGKETVHMVDVPMPTALSGSVASTSYQCDTGTGGTASVQVTSGAAPFTWFWDNGANTATNSNLNPGTYSVTVTDALGCTFSSAATVPVSGSLALAVSITPISCYDGADGIATVTSTGGTGPFSWLWDNGGTDSLQANLSAGTYAVTVQDTYGCSNTLSNLLTAPDPLVLQLDAPAKLCPGDSTLISVLASGGTAPYDMLWNTGDINTEFTTGAGDYMVTATDAHGCAATSMASIASSTPILLDVAIMPVTCHNSSDGAAAVFPISGEGPFTWLWENGATDSLQTNLSGDFYSVTVQDANGCIDVAEFYIFVPTPMMLYVDAPAHLCPGDSSMVSASVVGGTTPYSFLWSSGETTEKIMANAGTFTVVITDFYGCTTLQTIDIQGFSPITAQGAISPATASNAADGAILLTDIAGGAGGYSYYWNTGAVTQSLLNIPPGDYSLTIVDALGCYQVFHFAVSFAVGITGVAPADFLAKVYPNPSAASAQLSLVMPREQLLSVLFLDENGRVIFSDKVLVPAGESAIDLPRGLMAGVYWVVVRDVRGIKRVIAWVVR